MTYLRAVQKKTINLLLFVWHNSDGSQINTDFFDWGASRGGLFGLVEPLNEKIWEIT